MILNIYPRIDEILINPTGNSLIGGFDGDAGLTGKKNSVGCISIVC